MVMNLSLNLQRRKKNYVQENLTIWMELKLVESHYAEKSKLELGELRIFW